MESNNALLNSQGENYKNDLNNIQPLSKEIKVENKKIIYEANQLALIILYKKMRKKKKKNNLNNPNYK
jgi:hypothetical protein